MTIPFGVPVEPEVKMAYTGSMSSTPRRRAVRRGRSSGQANPSRSKRRGQYSARAWAVSASFSSYTRAAGERVSRMERSRGRGIWLSSGT